MAILSDIGYIGYDNSNQLLANLARYYPTTGWEALYDTLIEPVLPDIPEPKSALLYCPTFAPFEASDRLSRMIDDRRARGLTVVVSDPQETSFVPLIWYAQNVVKSAGVLVHFAGRQRMRASTHNRRHALIAGVAKGFEVPVLMLAEDSYDLPLDYASMAKRYETAAQCASIAQQWIGTLDFERVPWSHPRRSLRTALSGLGFGEHVAENELSGLADYFVETSAYTQVVDAKDTVFVGHRGTGKTANATQAFDAVIANSQNLGVLIKPPGFEFPSLLDALKKVPDSQHDYFFDALWRFLIQTEIASTVIAKLASRTKGVPYSADEIRFLEYAQNAPFDLAADMSVRLEQALNSILTRLDSVVATGGRRNLINEALHSEALELLRHELGPVLKGKRRVAVFVDNLDKGWERESDFRILARLILGLLSAKGQVVRDFSRQDYWRDQVNLTVAVFLRSDIYEYVRAQAREPDKLPISTIQWRDPETLRSVIEARYLAARPPGHSADALWSTSFAPEVGGLPTREYLVRQVLPRPRDIIFFCNSAVNRALDRRHSRVEEDDFRAAEGTYSQYAYEALLVENGITIPEMEDALFSLLAAPRVMTRAEAYAAMEREGIPSGKCESLVEKLIAMGFFGIEVAADQFVYPEVGTEARKMYALASRHKPVAQTRRLEIHPAFHRFLEIG